KPTSHTPTCWSSTHALDPHPARVRARSRSQRRGPALRAEPARPRVRQPAEAEAADRVRVQPERNRPERLLAGRRGRELQTQGDPRTAGAVQEANADASWS